MHPVHGRRRAASTVSPPDGGTVRGRRRAGAPATITLRRIGTFTGLAAAATGLAAATILPLVQAGAQDMAGDRTEFQTSAAAAPGAAATAEGTPAFSRSALDSEAAPRQANESRPDAGSQTPAGPVPAAEPTAPATAGAQEPDAPATAAAQAPAGPASAATRETVPPAAAAAKQAAPSAAAAAKEAAGPATAAASESAAPAERAVPSEAAPLERSVRRKAAVPAEPAPSSEAPVPAEPSASATSPAPRSPAADAPEAQEHPDRDHRTDGPDRRWRDRHWWGEGHWHRGRK